MNRTRYFYLAKLINAKGDHVASEEVWSDHGQPPCTVQHAARSAAAFFESANETLADHRIVILGPYLASMPTCVYEVARDDDGEFAATRAADQSSPWP